MSSLEHRRVAILRAGDQATDLAERLSQAGAMPVLCPVITIAPPTSYDALDRALAQAARYAWIVFTSANAVTAVAGRVRSLQQALPAATRLAAVGPATAAATRRRFGDPDLVPAEHTAAALARALPLEPGARVLLPLGELAGDELEQALLARRAQVDRATVYRTLPDPDGLCALDAALSSAPLDAVVFTSASTARFSAELLAASALAVLRDAVKRPALICIGPSTAAAARACELPVDLIAEPHTTEGVMRALEHWFAAGR